MDKPTYPFLVLDNGERFEFESVSQHTKIQKIIEFREMEITNLYNLALVDVKHEGSYDDMSISNNNDMETVLATVIKTIEIFLNLHMGAKIIFMGSTESRTRLYRGIIDKYLLEAELNTKFTVYMNGGMRYSSGTKIMMHF